MASPAWSLLVLTLVFTTINGSFAARHLLDTTTAAPEAAPTTLKPTIPSIPTALPPMTSIPKYPIPTTIPTALPPVSFIPNIPSLPTVPTTLPPIPAIPSNIPSIPTTMPKIPVFQMPPISSPPSTASP